jgi:hypothetical protein
MKTIDQFIQDNRLVMTVEPTETNPNMQSTNDWNRDANHYQCTIVRRLDGMANRSMTVFYSMGSGLSGNPTLVEVLSCLANDASTIEDTQSFEDYASDMGFDPDSRRAEKTYKACVKQSAELKTLLGKETYSTLLWDTERL